MTHIYNLLQDGVYHDLRHGIVERVPRHKLQACFDVLQVGPSLFTALSATQGESQVVGRPRARDTRLTHPGLEFLLAANVPRDSCTSPAREFAAFEVVGLAVGLWPHASWVQTVLCDGVDDELGLVRFPAQRSQQF